MESKIVELETFTPLFIKGKEDEYGEGFIRIGNDVFLIDNDNLCEFIYKKTYDKTGNKIPDGPDYVEWYSYFISRQQSENIITHYKEFARAFGLNEIDEERRIPKGYKEKSIQFFLTKTRLLQGNNDTQKEVLIESKIGKGITKIEPSNRNGKRFTQNGNSRYYIPGSSLKGAIRNAILWKIISLRKTQTSPEDVLEGYKKSLKGIALANEALELASNKQWSDAKQKFERAVQIEFPEREMLLKCKEGGRINFFRKKSDGGKTSLDKTLIQFTQSWGKSLITKTLIRPNSLIRKHKIRWQSTDDILRDILKIVKISDANLTGEVALEKKQLNVICKGPDNLIYKKYNHRNRQNGYQPIKLELETLPLATKATFKVTIDKEMANMFFGDSAESEYPFLYSVSNLLEVVNEFFLSVWEEEEKFFSNGAHSVSSITDETDEQKAVDVARIHDLYNMCPILSNEKLLRTGWGGGYISKTQFLHFDDVSRTNIRNLRHYRDNQIAPKSRLLIVEGGRAVSPLGWCKLRVLGDAKDTLFPSIDTATIKTDFPTEQSRVRLGDLPNRQGGRKNQERPVSEKEIQQLKETANKIIKRAERQKTSASHKTYKTGEKVSAVVENCIPFQSVTVKINEQTLIIKKGIIKQKGETVTLQITKTENGEIIEAKIL